MPFANDCLDKVGVCPNRLYVLSVPQGSEQHVQMQLIEPLTGELVDLTAYGITNETSSSSSSSSGCEVLDTGVEVYMKARYEDAVPFAMMQAIVTDMDSAKNGIIKIPFDHLSTRHPGIFVANVVVRQSKIVRRVIPFYIEISINLMNFNCTGPLSIAEIRMATRDVCPEMNFLIDTVEFKDEEIAWAIRRPVDYWNEAQPPLIQVYSAIDFPFRYNWTEGTIAVLLRTVALWLRRNDLDYTAGGVSVADTKKWPEYERMANERWQMYMEWVKNKKMELNIADGFQSLGGYRANPYR